MILNDGPTPLYYQLKSIIEDRIRSRELRERERLPSEAQLCREFNVSRITVRQALAELHRDGLIHREPGRGSFVSVGAGWKRPVLKGLIENVMASGVGTQIKVLSYEEIPLPKELSKILKTRRPKRVCRCRRVLGFRDDVYCSISEEVSAANRGAVSPRGFELSARRIGRLMRDQFNLGFVDVGGWDTHVNQGAATGYLADRLGELGRGLSGFSEEIGPSGRATPPPPPPPHPPPPPRGTATAAPITATAACTG